MLIYMNSVTLVVVALLLALYGNTLSSLLRRFPIFLRTKWGKRFCDRVIEELGLVKSTRQDLEYQKLLWQPYRNELEDWKQRRGFVDQILDREVEKMFPGFQKKRNDVSSSKSGEDKTSSQSATKAGECIVRVTCV